MSKWRSWELEPWDSGSVPALAKAGEFVVVSMHSFGSRLGIMSLN